MMEWHEIPVETLRDRAIEALGRNDEEAYKKNLVYIYRLLKEREFQDIRLPDDIEDVSVYRQSLDAVLHMSQFGLRTLPDDILELTHFGLMADCADVSKGYEHLRNREKIICLYRQAIRKLEAEKERRMRVYGRDAGYWEQVEHNEMV